MALLYIFKDPGAAGLEFGEEVTGPKAAGVGAEKW